MLTITKRIDAITAIPPDYLRTDPPAPRAVKIELTGRCNYRCSFCALATRTCQPTVRDDMPLEFFKRITTEMREAGVEEIGLFYIGESFMNPELLIAACEFVKRELRMPYVFLTTNGSLATPAHVRRLMAAGLDSLKWSINAADLDQFSCVMRVKSSLYTQAIHNIRQARQIRDEAQYPCRIYASSIRFDGEQQEKMERLLAEHVLPYVDEHYWLPLYSMATMAQQREEQLGYRPIAGNQGRIGALRDPLPCWSVFTEGHVTCSGLLSACCFDQDGRFAMGDLHEVSFREAWRSARFQALRAAHLRKDVSGTSCAGCIAYA